MLVYEKSSFNHHMFHTFSFFEFMSVLNSFSFCLSYSPLPVSFFHYVSWLLIFIFTLFLFCFASNRQLYWYIFSINIDDLQHTHRWIAIMQFFLHMYTVIWFPFCYARFSNVIVSPHKRKMASKTEREKDKRFVLSLIAAEKTLEDA